MPELHRRAHVPPRGQPACLPHLRPYGGRPAKCPECEDPKIKYSGTGTEKVEEPVAAFFPEAVVRRMDADAMTRKDAYGRRSTRFERAKSISWSARR